MRVGNINLGHRNNQTKVEDNVSKVSPSLGLCQHMQTTMSGEMQDMTAKSMVRDSLVDGDDLMTLNLRGTQFLVNVKQLISSTYSTLYKLGEIWRENDNGKTLFIDKNPDILHCILDYHATGELHLPKHLCGQEIRREMLFWGVGIEKVSPCCLANIMEDSKKANRLKEILNGWDPKERILASATGISGRFSQCYFDPFSSAFGIIGYVIMSLLFLLFLAILTMGSMHQFREEIHPEPNGTAIYESYVEYIGKTTAAYWLRVLDLILLTFFTVSVLFFFILSPSKRILWINWPVILCTACLLIQWLPVPVSLMYGKGKLRHWPRGLLTVINWLKVVRIVPILQMLFHFRSIQVIGKALGKSKNELALLIILILLSSGMFGYLVYMSEIKEPDTHFRSIPDGLWWGIVTLTTVGYGDFYPQGVAGKIIGACCAITGIVVLALPVPIIAGNFTTIYGEVETADYHRKLVKMAEERTKDLEHEPLGIEMPQKSIISASM